MAKSWDNDPLLFAGLVAEDVGKKQRIISLALLTEIVYRSPVKDGYFRNSTVVSIGSPDYSYPAEPDKSESGPIQRGNAVIAQGKPYSVIYIQNNRPYAEKLENGHSKQAPAGVFGVSFHGVTQAYK